MAGPDRATPYQTILQKAENEGRIPQELLGLLPAKWEFLGDILSIKLHPRLAPYRGELGALYASVLKVKTVVQDVGGISGPTRRPNIEVIFGNETRTVHVENGIRYHMDVAEVMFASGNIDERRMAAGLDCRGQDVLDMFAGIGYFTLPVAKYAGARRVIACEINPVAAGYLEKNVASNGVVGIVEVRQGDCRDVAPRRWAHRIFMGYLHDTYRFLPAALAALRPEGGIIHYHELWPDDLLPAGPVGRVEEAAARSEHMVSSARVRKVKSYAPGIWHVVVDTELVAR